LRKGCLLLGSPFLVRVRTLWGPQDEVNGRKQAAARMGGGGLNNN
jgi:hypothetical protein